MTDDQMSEINSIYKEILKKLDQGSRGLTLLQPHQKKMIFLFLDDFLCHDFSQPHGKNGPTRTKEWYHDNLTKVLCLIEHSAKPLERLEPQLIQLLNATELSVEIIIFTLNCSRKHIVDARMQQGKRLDFSFLESLKKLLFHPHPEVVEWTLRLIEGCGHQGIYFSKDLQLIKPPLWKWFNPHWRAVREIIALLQHRWNPRHPMT